MDWALRGSKSSVSRDMCYKNMINNKIEFEYGTFHSSMSLLYKDIEDFKPILQCYKVF